MASDQPRRRPPAEPAWQNPADSGNVPITRNRAVAVGLWNDSDFAASPHLTPVSADALRSGGLKVWPRVPPRGIGVQAAAVAGDADGYTLVISVPYHELCNFALIWAKCFTDCRCPSFMRLSKRW